MDAQDAEARPAVSPRLRTTSSASGTGRNGPILTPSHLRLDSRILIAHTTSSWLSNGVFCILLLNKLVGGALASASWWAIFVPMWLQHTIHIPLQFLVIMERDTAIYRQIGPPPPATASPGLHLQYSALKRMRTRTHVIDAINSIVDSLAMLLSKILFCWCLATDGSLGALPMRVVFAPLWVGWVLATLTTCMKDRAERVFGSTRDLLYLFLLFVALKVDGLVGVSWSVVFVVPWIWFSALFLIALMVLVVLLFARVWARLRELVLPLGFLVLLLSTTPQFVSYINLVRLLDLAEPTPSLQAILIPNAVSWFAMWLSSLLLGWGLRQKERVRDALLASGAVWTMHEQVARRMRNQDLDAVRAKIDRMSEEEVAALANEMMAGKRRPRAMLRVGNTLYREVHGEGDDGGTEAGQGESGRGVASKPGSPVVGRVAAGGALKAGQRALSAGVGSSDKVGAEVLGREAAATATAAAEGGIEASRQGTAEAAAPGSKSEAFEARCREEEEGEGEEAGEGEGEEEEGDAAAAHTAAASPHEAEVHASVRLSASGPEPLARRQGGGVAGAASLPLPHVALDLGEEPEQHGTQQRRAGSSSVFRLGSQREANNRLDGSFAAAAAVGQDGSGGGLGTLDLEQGQGTVGRSVELQRLPSRAWQTQQQQQQQQQGQQLQQWAPQPWRLSREPASMRLTSAFPSTSRRRSSADLAVASLPPYASSPAPALGTASSAAAAALPSPSHDPASPRPDDRASSASSWTQRTVWSQAASMQLNNSHQQPQLQLQQQGRHRPPSAGPSGRFSASGASSVALQHQQQLAGGAWAAAGLRGSRGPGALARGRSAYLEASVAASAAPPVVTRSASGFFRLVTDMDQNLGLVDEAALCGTDGVGEGAGEDAGGEGGGAVAAATAAAADREASDDLCIICYDNQASCVLLDCGHGGMCRRCAMLLFVRPPNECPTCRRGIEQVVQLAELRGIGQVCTCL